MADFPSLPLWTDAYLADTRHLSTVEHGAYLLLLMEAWRRPTCSLPDDDLILARLAQLSPDEWAQHKGIVMAFWKLDGRSKCWRQKRLTKQRDHARKHSKLQSDKAVKRWQTTKKDEAPALPKESRGNASISISTVAKATGGVAPPDQIKMIFDEGVALLTGVGRTNREARGLIGKWRKARGDDWVERAIIAARDGMVTDPVSWIEGRLRRQAGDDDARADYNSYIAEQARMMRAAEQVG